MGPMTQGDRRAVALGMALGATVGAVVALLLAPKRGVELRGDIVRSASRAGRTVAGSVRRKWDASLRRAGAGGGDDRAELDARNADMVAEGGPDHA